MTKRVTISAVNKALAEAGYPKDELCYADERFYFYFAGPTAVQFSSADVYASEINNLTVKEWVEEFKTKVRALGIDPNKTVSEKEPPVLFSQEQLKWLKENITLEESSSTDFYSPRCKSITINLKIADEVVSTVYFNVLD